MPPTHVELGTALGIGPVEAVTVLHELMASGYPEWVDEDDNIVIICPLSNQPNQYRISVDGEQKWSGQRGTESVSVFWLFPGKSIRIDAVCPDCGEPIVVEMSDGDVLSCDPEEAVSHNNGPANRSQVERCYGVDFLRSEEHFKRWKDLILESPPLMSVRDQTFVQGTESRKHCLNEDCFCEWNPERAREQDEAMAQLGDGRV